MPVLQLCTDQKKEKKTPRKKRKKRKKRARQFHPAHVMNRNVLGRRDILPLSRFRVTVYDDQREEGLKNRKKKGRRESRLEGRADRGPEPKRRLRAAAGAGAGAGASAGGPGCRSAESPHPLASRAARTTPAQARHRRQKQASSPPRLEVWAALWTTPRSPCLIFSPAKSIVPAATKNGCRQRHWTVVAYVNVNSS